MPQPLRHRVLSYVYLCQIKTSYFTLIKKRQTDYFSIVLHDPVIRNFTASVADVVKESNMEVVVTGHTLGETEKNHETLH
jgi:hypothetical protein